MRYQTKEAWAEFWRRQVGVWIAAGTINRQAGMGLSGLVTYIEMAWQYIPEGLVLERENGYGGVELSGRVVTLSDEGVLLENEDRILPYQGDWASRVAGYLRGN